MSVEKGIINDEFYFEHEAESEDDYKQETFVQKVLARSGVVFAGLGISVLLSIGGVMYFSNEEANSSQYSYASGGQYVQSSGQYNAQYAVAGGGSADAAAGGGGGCGGGGAAGGGDGCGGGGAAGGGGGGCGSGGGAGGSSSAASASPAELEKQGLEKFKAETGKSDVTVKVENRGCHTQIDIYDKAGNIVRSYGYQGGPLYVIK